MPTGQAGGRGGGQRLPRSGSPDGALFDHLGGSGSGARTGEGLIDLEVALALGGTLWPTSPDQPRRG
jgi:hypothetical protein